MRFAVVVFFGFWMSAVASAELVPHLVGCDKGVQAFKATLHPFVRAKCATCHDQPAPGPIQGPPHSISDPEGSYSRLLGYANFDNIAKSQLVTKGGNGHCVGYGVNCGVDAAMMEAQVKAWYDGGQKDCPKDYQKISADQTLPEKLPTPAEGWIPLRFDLSKISSELEGAIFEIEIQEFSKASSSSVGSYRFRRPRIATSEVAVGIEGIRILVNGKFDPRENSFSTVSQKVDTKPYNPKDVVLAFPMLSIKNQIVLLQDGTRAPDKIAIAFNKLEAVANPRCKAAGDFKTSVLNVMENRGCFYCHGGGATNYPGMPVARTRLNMTLAEEKLCALALQNSDLKDFALSPWIALPLRGQFNHPIALPFEDEVIPAWTSWMAKESTRKKKKEISNYEHH